MMEGGGVGVGGTTIYYYVKKLIFKSNDLPSLEFLRWVHLKSTRKEIIYNNWMIIGGGGDWNCVFIFI